MRQGPVSNGENHTPEAPIIMGLSGIGGRGLIPPTERADELSCLVYGVDHGNTIGGTTDGRIDGECHGRYITTSDIPASTDRYFNENTK